jgi:c-opsin
MIIKAPFTAKSLNLKSALYSMIISAALSLFLSTAPFYGWTRYTLEGANISCSIEWQSKDAEIISFNIFIFISTFLVPSIILIFSNLKIVFEVSNCIKLKTPSLP